MPDKEFFEDDPFWSIDNLMPKTKKGSPLPPKRPAGSADKPTNAPGGPANVPGEPANAHGEPAKTPDTTTATATPAPQAGNRKSVQSRRIDAFITPGETPEKRYTYEKGAVREVEIYSWQNAYSFFSGFRKNALTILKMNGEPCPYEPFFSFMPQYHQLTGNQLKYYLYWRQSFIEGVNLRADFCYLLLYAYEIINLPDEIPPARGANLLARLWRDYRNVYPKLDKYLSEWLEDYCFIHGVRPQKALFDAIAPFGRRSDAFREFYITEEEAAHPGLLLSGYSYKNSKYINNENRALFETHIPAAMAAFFEAQKSGAPAEECLQTATRTSYDGAVCVYGLKKRILLTYLPMHISDTAMQVTDAVRCCENYVRAYLGIRARLAVHSLTPSMRACIENYFKKNLPTRALEKAAQEEEIDARYEPEDHGFSDETAREIEQRSLLVADRLGSVFEKEAAKEPQTAVGAPPAAAAAGAKKAAPDKPEGSAPAGKNDLCKELLAVLVKSGSDAFTQAARARNMLPHSVKDAINEEAIERFGDVAVEEENGVFTPIEDYRKEIGEWITS